MTFLFILLMVDVVLANLCALVLAGGQLVQGHLDRRDDTNTGKAIDHHISVR